MHKGKEKKETTTTGLVCAWHLGFLIHCCPAHGWRREGSGLFYPSWQMWIWSLELLCVCFHHSCVQPTNDQQWDHPETEVPSGRPPALLHPHHAASAMQKSKSIGAEFWILQWFLPQWSAISASWQISFWALAGSSCLLSGSWVTVLNAKHVSSSPSSSLTTPCAVPSDYFNIIPNTASPLAYLCCLEQPLICQPRQSSNCFQTLFKKPLSCHFSALLVSLLLCDFYVVIHLNGNFPQKPGYVPPVTFFTCFLDIWSNE